MWIFYNFFSQSLLLKALSCGSTFESLNSDNIKNADVLIPDVAEQEKIGEYFANLDHLITLHQQKLKLLKQIKKAMVNCFLQKNIQKKVERSQKNMTFKYESDFEEALIKVLSIKGGKKKL